MLVLSIPPARIGQTNPYIKKKKRKRKGVGPGQAAKPIHTENQRKQRKNSADQTGSSPRTILVFIRRLACGARCDATCSPRLQPTRTISALEGDPPHSNLLPYNLWGGERLRCNTAVRCRWKKLVGVCLSAWFHATAIPFWFPVQLSVSTPCLFNLAGLDQADPRPSFISFGVDRVPPRSAGRT
ncbi:hypothetical protein BDW42DRAFT_186356 [Aspergillus taichungensis]|uniref:Uncharacterized protein n=1 Tax=Aspergillus taichungensis TaxID=482145 RepID=A0A2J5HS84_9EURO|nr:hypothetical protein BDW42DRAFT_186356 [Aspergillus taichungensis]